MFDAYGKLQTGLVRLDLTLPSLVDVSKNAGLLPPPNKKPERSEWKEEDPVWKASRILDHLERFDNQRGDSNAARGGSKTFGEIPSVPWLDALAKEYCEKTLNEAKEMVDVSCSVMVCYCYLRLFTTKLCLETPYITASFAIDRRQYPLLSHCGTSSLRSPSYA